MEIASMISTGMKSVMKMKFMAVLMSLPVISILRQLKMTNVFSLKPTTIAMEIVLKISITMGCVMN